MAWKGLRLKTSVRRRAGAAAGLACLVFATAGCSVATSTYQDASTAAGSIVGSLSSAPPPAPQDAALPPPAPSMGSFLEGPTGTRLVGADRQRAFQAEQDALASGDRKTWRGVKGNYGFVSLSGGPTSAGCQEFSHTIYIMGRPVTGKGTGCKSPDGTWTITG